MNNRTWRPDLSDPGVQKRLAPRNAIYFNLISYCRHIGLRKLDDRNSTWVARIRRKDGGYTQNCLGHATQAGENLMSYEEAVECAERWFRRSDVRRIAAEPYQVGSKRTLSICPIGLEYSVGHALADYLDWKRLRRHLECRDFCIAMG
ncbi:hypothetical protein [Sinisalibacter aestuarii]|uniref:Integrase n=1 Tax=Sinisalibacter aestuarii TaxID=2949426 RepID=A0ABQ5LXZ9_9RHOB|nr:hypothetical protein [Sinisalibacter aestuarii]GKY89852.1 hypothetical protein STA1M1_37210 [Sinisalibacter aestuarii]